MIDAARFSQTFRVVEKVKTEITRWASSVLPRCWYRVSMLKQLCNSSRPTRHFFIRSQIESEKKGTHEGSERWWLSWFFVASTWKRNRDHNTRSIHHSAFNSPGCVIKIQKCHVDTKKSTRSNRLSKCRVVFWEDVQLSQLKVFRDFLSRLSPSLPVAFVKT